MSGDSGAEPLVVQAHAIGSGLWEYHLPDPAERFRLLLSTREFGDAGPSGEPLAAEVSERLASAGITPLVRVRQEHTRRILEADLVKPDSPAADGIATGPGGAWLGVTVADCMPIVVIGDRGERMLLHSGWKGTGILEAALLRLSKPQDALVFLGPAIDAADYPVNEPRARRFAAEHGTNAVRYCAGSFRLDMYAANFNISRRFGVAKVFAAAQRSSDPRLPSFRRDGADYTRAIFLLGPDSSAEKQ